MKKSINFFIILAFFSNTTLACENITSFKQLNQIEDSFAMCKSATNGMSAFLAGISITLGYSTAPLTAGVSIGMGFMIGVSLYTITNILGTYYCLKQKKLNQKHLKLINGAQLFE